MILTENETRARERLCIALDTPDTQKAYVMAHELSEFSGVFKIGPVLYTPASDIGEPIVGEMRRFGRIFLDNKWKDKPNVVYEAAKAAAAAGVDMFTVHIDGGKDMCEAALDGAFRGARHGRPLVIGVTVLTSTGDENSWNYLGMTYTDLVKHRAGLAKEYRLDGFTCPGSMAAELEAELGRHLIKILPGVELNGLAGEGQMHPYEPRVALENCANSIIVAGTAIRKAPNMRKAAYQMLRAMAPYV